MEMFEYTPRRICLIALQDEALSDLSTTLERKARIRRLGARQLCKTDKPAAMLLQRFIGIGILQ